MYQRKSILKVAKKKKKKIKLHALINNAAIDLKKKCLILKNLKLLLLKMRKHLDVGLTGAMLCSKHFGKYYPKRKMLL